METQVKRPTTLDEQLKLLAKRGMEIDEALARQWLSSVSYYRMSGYWYPYRVLPSESDTKNPEQLDEFVTGTSFIEVAGLYEFDRKLRALVHDGIERIEVALRTRIGEWIVQKDALAYRDSSLFRKDFDHVAWLARVYSRLARAKSSNSSIKHHKEKYGQYPFWVVAEVLDFSDMSFLFVGAVLDLFDCWLGHNQHVRDLPL